MKKVMTFLQLLLSCFVLAACGGYAAFNEPEPTPSQPVAEMPPQQEIAVLKPEPVKAEVFAKMNATVSAGIVFDSNGHMLVGTNEGIVKITPDAQVSMFCSFKGLGGQKFFFGSPLAWDMVMDSDGNIYAAAQDRILKISPEGKILPFIEDKFSAGFLGATGIELDPQGNLLVTNGSSIVKYSPDLERSVFADVSGMGDMSLFSLRFDPEYENLYASEFNTRSLLRIPIQADGSAGEPEVLIRAPIPTSGGSPLNIVFSEGGNLYCSLDCRWTLLRMTEDDIFELVDMPRAGENHCIAFGGAGFDEESIYFTTYAGKAIYRFPVGEKGNP